MKRKSPFTLIEIMMVVVIIGFLAVIAIPGFMKARATTQKNTCIEGMRVVDQAAQQWAMENNATTGDAIAALALLPYMRNATMPTCRGVAIAQPAKVDDKPVCPNLVKCPDHVLP